MPSSGNTPEARVEPLPVDDVNGLSSLVVDDRGALWAVAERQRMLLEIPPGGASPRRVPIEGVAEGLELESMAWLGGNRFAVGTESSCDDKAETILIVAINGDRATVERSLSLPVSTWPVQCDDRHGIEGLCHAGGRLVVGLEQSVEEGGKRFAPVARVDPSTGAATPYRIELSSDKGKVSSLDCRARGDSIEVLAIERHFEVSRILGFSIPLDGPAGKAISPSRIVADLVPHTNGNKRNFEGIAWLDEKHVALIIDNHYGRVTGPNELLRLELSGPSTTAP